MRGFEITKMGDKDKKLSTYISLYYFDDVCLIKQQQTHDTKRGTTTAQVRATQLTAERCLHDTRVGFTDTKLVPISFSHRSSLLKTLGEASEMHNNAWMTRAQKGGCMYVKQKKCVLIFDVTTLSKLYTVHLSSETQKIAEVTSNPIFFIFR